MIPDYFLLKEVFLIYNLSKRFSLPVFLQYFDSMMDIASYIVNYTNSFREDMEITLTERIETALKNRKAEVFIDYGFITVYGGNGTPFLYKKFVEDYVDIYKEVLKKQNILLSIPLFKIKLKLFVNENDKFEEPGTILTEKEVTDLINEIEISLPVLFNNDVELIDMDVTGINFSYDIIFNNDFEKTAVPKEYTADININLLSNNTNVKIKELTSTYEEKSDPPSTLSVFLNKYIEDIYDSKILQ